MRTKIFTDVNYNEENFSKSSMIINLPTYNDIINKNISRIFEYEEIKGFSRQQINEAEQVYDKILEKIKKGEDLEEGFLSGLLGSGIGALTGPAIMRAVCKALGIIEDGNLGKLLTSRLVAAAVGYTLGK
jgi:hypothetical protein